MKIILNVREMDDSLIVIHNFIWQHHFQFHACMMQRLKHIYLISVSINRMFNLSIKMIFRCKICFHIDSMLIV